MNFAASACCFSTIGTIEVCTLPSTFFLVRHVHTSWPKHVHGQTSIFQKLHRQRIQLAGEAAAV